MLSDFSWKFWRWHLYTKIRTLFVTGIFNIQKARHSAKIKTICFTILCSKIRTLCITRFSLNFWNWRLGGGIFTCKKQCTLRYIFIFKKNSICVTFYIQKSRHYALHFIQKKSYFWLRLYVLYGWMRCLAFT